MDAARGYPRSSLSNGRAGNERHLSRRLGAGTVVVGGTGRLHDVAQKRACRGGGYTASPVSRGCADTGSTDKSAECIEKRVWISRRRRGLAQQGWWCGRTESHQTDGAATRRGRG